MKEIEWEKVIILTCASKGRSYYDNDVSETMMLVREKDNKVNVNAIKVINIEKDMIGYVEKCTAK